MVSYEMKPKLKMNQVCGCLVIYDERCGSENVCRCVKQGVREKPKQRAETDWVLHRSEALLRLNCLISRPCVPVLVCTCAMVWWMAERVISTKHTGIHNGFSFGLCGHNWLWHYVWSASMVVPQPMCSMCCSHSSHNSKSKDGQKKISWKHCTLNNFELV